MTSSKRTAANRVNARHSTGPRSAEGKAHSRLNALKHGLAVPSSALPEFAQAITQLARTIAGNAADIPPVYQAAVRVAEAAMDVLRARRAQIELWSWMAQEPDVLAPSPADEPMPVRPKRVQFSQPAYVRAYVDGTHQQLRASELASLTREIAYDADVERIKQRRKDAKQRIRGAASTWAQLDKLDRYERRALSRRNKAIKAFDEARAAADHRSADHLPAFWQNKRKEGANTQ
jgi:hypothetical protein